MKKQAESARFRLQQVAIHIAQIVWVIITTLLFWCLFGGAGLLALSPIWIQALSAVGLLTLCYAGYLGSLWALVAIFLTR